MTDIDKIFKEATTMLTVTRTSRMLEAEGYDKAEVNAAATKRKRELLTMNNSEYRMLHKVFAPVIEHTQKVSRINAKFQDMRGTRLCIMQKTGEFIWK